MELGASDVNVLTAVIWRSVSGEDTVPSAAKMLGQMVSKMMQ